MNTEDKSQARLAAELVIGKFWLGQVTRAAQHVLAEKRASCLVMYSPTEEQYADATVMIEALCQPSKTELAVAVPDETRSEDA